MSISIFIEALKQTLFILLACITNPQMLFKWSANDECVVNLSWVIYVIIFYPLTFLLVLVSSLECLANRDQYVYSLLLGYSWDEIGRYHRYFCTIYYILCGVNYRIYFEQWIFAHICFAKNVIFVWYPVTV